ncbi:MAG: hypothetical protein M2R45_02642 [Verrucomicrobia subdivision 3 bacterium]|nr:hypothetical protein [Limisphaerales bacterium]MCS1414019.1 hypothetical protein [Limisphaerales bacterium]
MRVGTVIGRVTLNKTVPALKGARWLVVSSYGRNEFEKHDGSTVLISPAPSLVVFDNIGGGVGDTIGFVEGREATSSFDDPTPIDAINAALIDEIFYSPKQ